jgi:HK97 gp10 family phage protein
VSGVNWFGAEENARIDRELRKRLHRASIVVSRRAKRLLNVSGTGKFTDPFLGYEQSYDPTMVHWTVVRGWVAAGKVKRHRGGTRKRVYNAFPSKPGDPPHKQTGRLRSSVTYEVLDGELIARVGTNVKYAKWLELGTKNMAPRPWLRRALNESGDEIDRIMGA